ncbi:hypothetical protein M527_04855 [Sphingobium indicum IP26]|uniref:LysR family transcriptional regulator n=1 Tax=Sphingobium indicum F2 TaxID=1450518 RepID=A0A8E0WVJ5_9SPHN|nr:LysR family transcriptional regulator [Sphingobium indicum]EPR11048.1 hypothetical protein M527_02970 [Sphingobium indicum IP26]EPR11418.1 hypothetical protein M527_04855 [Sphingobium indicum IP26]KER38186.1 LysR family transcriptional regulator [Sphingobium indicum F2]
MTSRKKPIDAASRTRALPANPAAPPVRSAARRGAASFQDRLRRIDWQDLELFLDVAEAGSLRAGAAKTGHAVGTIRRRLARIEDKLGDIIAHRDPAGLQLTSSGDRLLNVAREMRRSRQFLEQEQTATGTRGCVRIAVTEGLGTYWVMPRLVDFQNANPEIDVVLHCDMQRSDVAGGECDIAIQLEHPSEGHMTICRRLGCLHLMPFASERYLSDAGIPRSVDDWPRHRLVWQEADQVASHLLPYFLGTTDIDGLIGIRTNSSSAHFRAIASGGGIGILPTYARAVSRRVKPLDINLQLRREILCVINPAREAVPEVRLALAWLQQCFSGELYPWFRDQFVHPSDFEDILSSQKVISLFEGFIDALNADET